MHLKYVTTALLAGHFGSAAAVQKSRSTGLSRGFIGANDVHGKAGASVTGAAPLVHLEPDKRSGRKHGMKHSSSGHGGSSKAHKSSGHEQGGKHSSQKKKKPTGHHSSSHKAGSSKASHPSPSRKAQESKGKTPSPKFQQGSSSSNSATSGKTYKGDITYYTPGLGSCGVTNNANDMIVALAKDMMAPGDGGNPNNNPLCGREIKISHAGKSATAKIQDTCPGCSGASLDLTPALFKKFAGLGVGRVEGVEWKFT